MIVVAGFVLKVPLAVNKYKMIIKVRYKLSELNIMNARKIASQGGGKEKKNTPCSLSPKQILSCRSKLKEGISRTVQTGCSNRT